MYRDRTANKARLIRSVLLLALALVLALGALAATGCSQAANSGSATPATTASKSTPANMASTASSKASVMAKSSDPSAMMCAQCSKKIKPTAVVGSAAVENGTQVVKISIKDGTYIPNTFTVKAGMPVTVSFEGTATGCLGHPTFKSLNKVADATKSSASLNLGTLAPGTYKFACSMGMNAGTLTVQ
jgi:plastocyanin